MKKEDWIEYYKTVHGKSPNEDQIREAQNLGEFIDENKTTTNTSSLKTVNHIQQIKGGIKNINKKFLYILGAILSILLLLIIGIGIGSAISTKSTSQDNVSKESSKVENEDIETITFTANGDYEFGTDIKPNSYYAVLTKLDYAPDDKEHQGYLAMSTVINDDIDVFEMIEKVGIAYKLDITDSGKLSLDDGYSPTSWELTLYTPEDYKKM